MLNDLFIVFSFWSASLIFLITFFYLTWNFSRSYLYTGPTLRFTSDFRCAWYSPLMARLTVTTHRKHKHVDWWKDDSNHGYWSAWNFTATTGHKESLFKTQWECGKWLEANSKQIGQISIKCSMVILHPVLCEPEPPEPGYWKEWILILVQTHWNPQDKWQPRWDCKGISLIQVH